MARTHSWTKRMCWGSRLAANISWVLSAPAQLDHLVGACDHSLLSVAFFRVEPSQASQVSLSVDPLCRFDALYGVQKNCLAVLALRVKTTARWGWTRGADLGIMVIILLIDEWPPLARYDGTKGRKRWME